VLANVLAMLTLLDRPDASGALVADHLSSLGDDACTISVTTAAGPDGSTDFVTVRVPGSRGATVGGDAPTLGIIGALGGVDARPAQIGYVSDGDGACAALAAASKLLDMHRRGDVLDGDVIVSTHVCPHAPTVPHDPVPFMGSPVDHDTMRAHEADPGMDAVISIDTTKGNKVINHRGIAISPTVKAGYILKVSADLLDVAEIVTGEPAHVLPITTQDITPYGNGISHLNSIMQPACATQAPVIGLAITAVTAVPGSATGASQETDIALAARFSVEVAKGFTAGTVLFHDAWEFDQLVLQYGSMTHLQRGGR
jgi:hypothetical protein